ncbi:NHS-like protein 1 [Arapaima gigas]
MPLYKRTVSPVYLCRLDARDPRTHGFDSMEELCDHALASLLRQLADLSRHASDVFSELENEASSLGARCGAVQLRLDRVRECARRLDHRRMKHTVSSLEEESKWTVHYTAPWHQQENVFLPSSRPACIEDLHRQAKVNLKTVLRECDKLRIDGTRSSQYYSQCPAFSTTSLYDSSLLDHGDPDKKSTVSSVEEERLLYSTPHHQPPLLENGQTRWSKTLPLPTPEEKMRQQAQCVLADIIPINVTGENFDRQASVRRSLVNTDTLGRRAKKVRRRKTITGVPDNIQKELGNGEMFQSHMMYVPGQCSTLGRVGSISSTLRYSCTRDSSCQTEEEVKIVQPSMRRIRAQKGHGIAAQMANFSNSSSGNVSTVSKCAGVTCAPQFSRSDQRFHSLPRQGVHISLHTDPSHTSTPLRSVDGTAGMHSLQVKNHSGQQERRQFQNNQATYPALFAGKSNTPPSSEAVAVTTEASSHVQHAVSSYPTDNPLSSTGHKEEQHLPSITLTSTPSRYDSAVSLSTGTLTETDSQCSNLDGRKGSCCKNAPSESNYSYGSLQSCSSITQDQWIYDSPPINSPVSNCSTPINPMCSSLEQPSSKTESSSLSSMDYDSDLTSMHLDLGPKSRSYSNINGTNHMQHTFYECKEHHSQDDRISLYSNKSLSRSISLRKAKKPPLPPTRTDSLRRKPGKNHLPNAKNAQSNSSLLSETLIATLQESLQLSLESNEVSPPNRSPSSDYEDLWVQCSRSQSSVSNGSGGKLSFGSNENVICTVKTLQNSSSNLHCDSGEPWTYQVGCAIPQTAGKTPGDFSTEGSQPGSRMLLPATQKDSVGVETKSSSSPDKRHQLTPPTSGHCSESNSLNTGNNLASLKKSLSPAGLRPKPKVPERKSSLSSSVSVSSSTQESSTITDSSKDSLDLTSLSFPLTLSVTSTQPTTLSPSSPTSPTALSPGKVSRQNFIPPSGLQITPRLSEDNPSTDFLTENSISSPVLSPPPPPPLPFSASVTPPSPHRSLTSQSIGTTLSLINIKDALKSVKPFSAEDSRHEKKVTNHCIEPDRFQKPPITAKALQMVQLRPVKKLEKVDNTARECSSDLPKAKHRHECLMPLPQEQSRNPETPIVLPFPASYGLSLNGMHTVTEFRQDLPKEPELSEVNQGGAINSVQLKDLPPLESLHSPLEGLDQPCLAALPEELSPSPKPTITSKHKLPSSPQKSKLTLIMPPVLCQPVTEEKKPLSLDAKGTVEISSTNEKSTLGTTDEQVFPQQLLEKEDKDGGLESSPSLGRQEPLNSGLSTDLMSHQLLDLSEDQELILCDERSTSDGDGDATSSTTGSISSKEEDNGEVFDSSTPTSSPGAMVDGKALEDVVTPTRPRTTEDLFAVIHRSKRKVLGWRETEEERRGSHSSSPPITPTSTTPGQGSLPRQTGSIQRSLRRTATSSDSFKALLLKKGCRSETSFRMSAAEILRSTDPRQQRSHSDSALDPNAGEPISPCTSPGQGRRAREQWARTEGMLPRFSPVFSASLMGTRHGRSRTPPSAASSRYSTRSRILSSPMTVICEREGELAEAADTCEPPESRTLSPLSQVQDSSSS